MKNLTTYVEVVCIFPFPDWCIRSRFSTGSSLGPGPSLGPSLGPGSLLGPSLGPGSLLGPSLGPGSSLGQGSLKRIKRS